MLRLTTTDTGQSGSLPLGPSVQISPRRLTTWIQSDVSSEDLSNADTYCVMEVPIASHLNHFLPFWKEVIQAEYWR